jgi:hypothetical protein
MLDESRIQQETLRVIESSAHHSKNAAAHVPEISKIPRMRDEVQVHQVAMVVAATASALKKENKDQKVGSNKHEEFKPKVVAAPVSPKKWNWQQWQEQEKRALSMTSSLPTSAAAAEVIANKAESARIAADKADENRRAATASSGKQHESAAAPRTADSNQHTARSPPLLTRPGNKILVHAQAVAKVQNARAGLKLALAPSSKDNLAPSQGATRPDFQAKWNWAQWQEEAKQLLVNHPSHSSSLARQRPTSASSATSTSKSAKTPPAAVRKPVSGADTAAASAPATGAASAAAKRNAPNAATLLRRVKTIAEMQKNAEVLTLLALMVQSTCFTGTKVKKTLLRRVKKIAEMQKDAEVLTLLALLVPKYKN